MGMHGSHVFDGARVVETRGAELSTLLSAWQASGDHDAFHALVAGIRVDALRLIARVLRHLGIRDPDATDDAFALVLGHLRRLPGAGDGERHVARFKGTPLAAHGDPGAAFIHWLCRERALDVARSRRRQGRRCRAFTDLDDALKCRIDSLPLACGGVPDTLAMDGHDLRRAALHLDARQRAVIELVLEGKTLAVIAHVLGVSEGTVSRIRVRAIAELRAILGGDAGSET